MEGVEKVIGMAKVHGNGRIQVPRRVRELLGVEDGDFVLFIMEGGRVYLSRAYTSPFAERL